jgi:hypothetical protein
LALHRITPALGDLSSRSRKARADIVPKRPANALDAVRSDLGFRDQNCAIGSEEALMVRLVNAIRGTSQELTKADAERFDWRLIGDLIDLLDGLV